MDAQPEAPPLQVGDRDPVSASAHHRGDALCADVDGPFRCTRPRNHLDEQHVAWSADTGRALAVWPRQESATLAEVRAAARTYARLQELRDAARDRLADRIRAAHAAGEQPKELIAASGLARQTVFDAIKKTPDGGPPVDERPEVVSYP